MNKIPLVNLERQYECLRGEILEITDQVFRSGAFISGPYVRTFEKEFAASHDARFGIGCSSGTSALTVILQALGLKAGDEAITTPHTFFATAESMLAIGVTPKFVDVDPETHCLDVRKLEAAMTPKVKAIVPVHIYGNPCDLPNLQAFAKKHRIALVEDCAQSHFARIGGKFVGSTSDGAAFSFYPGKNLGAPGDAGFIFAGSESVSNIARKLCDHGRSEKYLHDSVGFNHRMDGLHGAILSLKLKRMPEYTKKRVALAKRYQSAFAGKGYKMPAAYPTAEPVYHLFVVEVSNRARVLESLNAVGIQAGVHYPVPLHLQPALKFLGYARGSLPVAERVADRVVSLPLCPELTESEQDFVIQKFLEVAEK